MGMECLGTPPSVFSTSNLLCEIVISFSYSVLVDDVKHNRHLALEGAEVDVHHSADLEELSEDL